MRALFFHRTANFSQVLAKAVIFISPVLGQIFAEGELLAQTFAAVHNFRLPVFRIPDGFRGRNNL